MNPLTTVFAANMLDLHVYVHICSSFLPVYVLHVFFSDYILSIGDKQGIMRGYDFDMH